MKAAIVIQRPETDVHPIDHIIVNQYALLFHPYEKLTDAQKGYVTNYDTLLAAEAKLAELKAAQEKPSGGQTPKTGDDANLTLSLIGILMSMIALCGVLAAFRKEKNA